MKASHGGKIGGCQSFACAAVSTFSFCFDFNYSHIWDETFSLIFVSSYLLLLERRRRMLAILLFLLKSLGLYCSKAQPSPPLPSFLLRQKAELEDLSL